MGRIWLRRSAYGGAAAAVLAAVFGAIYAAGGFGSQPPQVQTAYLSPSGSDGNACTLTSPCLTFSHAYQQTLPGGTVLVGCGGAPTCSYPPQDIPYTVARANPGACRAAETFPDGTTTPNDTSGCITFEPQPGGTPTIASVAVEVPYVQLSGLTFSNGVFAGANIGRTNAPCAAWNVHDVVLRNLTAPSFTVDAASYVYVEGGSYGPLLDQASHVSGCRDASGAYVQGSHLAIDRTVLHDYRQTRVGAHLECLQFQGSDQSVILNSRFFNCGQQGISFETNLGVSSINGLLLLNDVFDAACSHPQPGDVCGVVSGGTTTFICDGPGQTLANVVMRFNTLNGSPSFQRIGSCAMSNILLTGNILVGPAFDSACNNAHSEGVTYAFNAFTNASGVACGEGNVLGALPATTWVDPANFDYRLQRGSRAIDVVPAAPGLPRDMNGVPRPLRGRADAGSYQWEGPFMTLGRSIGRVRLGEQENDVVGVYGQPRRAATVSLGKRRLRRLTYVLHEGTLWVILDGGKVVGVGTTSSFYTTRTGLGAGAPLLRSAAAAGWASCRSAYRRSIGSTVVYFGPAGGKRGKRIASVFMLERAYAPC